VRFARFAVPCDAPPAAMPLSVEAHAADNWDAAH
jgi:hypothetical protein